MMVYHVLHNLDENGEATDCTGYDDCKKYLVKHPEDVSDWGMCNGCDHYHTTGGE